MYKPIVKIEHYLFKTVKETICIALPERYLDLLMLYGIQKLKGK